MLAAPRKHGIALYVLLNVAFFLVLACGCGVGEPQNPRLLYLIILFALCSSCVVDNDGLNGRYALLAIFLGTYFLYFGVQDVTNLFTGLSDGAAGSQLSVSEQIILAGLICMIVAYRIAVSVANPAGRIRRSNDWSLRSTLSVGAALWALGIASTYYWYFFVVTDKTLEGTRGIAQLSGWTTSGLILGQMLEPIGLLLIVYAWRSTRSKPLLALLLAILVVQSLCGFVIDIKGMALIGGTLVIVTVTQMDGRIPKAWVFGVAIFIYTAFPVFQAYRAVVTGNGVARTEVLANLGKTIDKVLEAKERVNSGHDRAQTIFERLSLKASVEMIVNGTEKGVPFQDGYTLTPILAAFIPRLIWPDKPDVPTGRLVNKAFTFAEQEETYISPSHIGEMYWNFGWAGVLVGMTVVGALCGIVARFNLGECRTVTRLLIFIVTVNQIIHGFESSIAACYVIWMRSLAVIGILHLVFARAPVNGRLPASSRTREESAADTPPRRAPLFANLLR